MSYRIHSREECDKTTDGKGVWNRFPGVSPETAEVGGMLRARSKRREQGTYRASRSLSRRARMSLVLTGPLTLRIMVRLVSSRNSTRTWVTPPREPVLPRTYAKGCQAVGFKDITHFWKDLGDGSKLDGDLS